MKKLLLLPLLLITCFCLAQDAKQIIGEPIKIGNLLVAEYDFTDELNVMYKNKEKIGGFANNGYWSSTEGKILSLETEGEFIDAWQQSFGFIGSQFNDYKNYPNYVRAVRAF